MLMHNNSWEHIYFSSLCGRMPLGVSSIRVTVCIEKGQIVPWNLMCSSRIVFEEGLIKSKRPRHNSDGIGNEPLWLHSALERLPFEFPQLLLSLLQAAHVFNGDRVAISLLCQTNPRWKTRFRWTFWCTFKSTEKIETARRGLFILAVIAFAIFQTLATRVELNWSQLSKPETNKTPALDRFLA